MKNVIFFLLDRQNNWIKKKLKSYLINFPKKYKYAITEDAKKLNDKIVFVISYTKILKNTFLKRNKEVFIIHPSKLPRDKGFAPVQNQVLRNKNLIHITLIKASNKVDSGPVGIRNKFLLIGHELSGEIREIQALAIFDIIKKFLKKYPDIQYKNQKGLGTFNKKRSFTDNKLNINKSIKSQFNLLRIVNNKLYPAFFEHKKHTYLLKIVKK